MAQIAWTDIHVKISKSGKCKKAALEAAQEKLDLAKEELLQEFDSHVVTQELEEGPDGANISGTLNGYGNLFSFIGFYEGDEPTEYIRELLSNKNFAKLKEQAYGTSFVKGGEIRFRFAINYPSFDEITKNFKYPKWSAGSWLQDLESGIYGLEFYLHDDFGAYVQSRSTTGLQAKSKNGEMIVIRGQELSTPIKYISEILDKFKAALLV